MLSNRTIDKPRKNLTNYLILPSVIFVAAITQIPFLLTLILSFVRWNVKRPDLPIEFAGLDNYVFIFTDSKFYRVLFNSLLQAGIALALCTILGFLLALVFNRAFRGDLYSSLADHYPVFHNGIGNGYYMENADPEPVIRNQPGNGKFSGDGTRSVLQQQAVACDGHDTDSMAVDSVSFHDPAGGIAEPFR